MDIAELTGYLNSLAASLKNEERDLLSARLKSLTSAFPFNEYEYCLMFLLDKTVIDFIQYEKLRNDYVSANKYLELYELSPRVFGQVWGHQHIQDLDPRFEVPDKAIDPDFDGEYDLCIGNIKVEVKASRAINTAKRKGLASKALQYESREPFWMNFQQLKPSNCDVFVFLGVWVDRIIYWVLSTDEVRNNNYISHQHRGGIEYQIGITHRNIRDFEQFSVDPSKIADYVIRKGK